MAGTTFVENAQIEMPIKNNLGYMTLDIIGTLHTSHMSIVTHLRTFGYVICYVQMLYDLGRKRGKQNSFQN